MLGLIGFSIAAITFVAYAVSVLQLRSKQTNFNLTTYAAAYFITAAACVVWAIAMQTSGTTLKSAVLLGDILLIIASLSLLMVILPPKASKLYMLAASAIAILAVVYRSTVNTLPVVRDGVLVFYTPKLFGAFIIIVILTIWLRANMNFYDAVIRQKLGFNQLRASYFSANILSLLGISGFLFAHKSITIVIAFSMIVLGSLMLAILNFAINNRIAEGVQHAG